MNNKIAVLASSVVVAAALLSAGTAFAQGPSTMYGKGNWGSRGGDDMQVMQHLMPGVFGIVSAINGTTLTLTSKGFGRGMGSTTKTYTVNAGSATVFKNGATSTLSSVAIGDMVLAAGTLSGTSLTATSIRDGFGAMGGKGMGGKGDKGPHATSTPIMEGNGQPVVGGTVSVISGNTLTVTTAQGNVTYSVDVTNATIKKGNATSSVSGIAVGDKVVIQGAVNGTSVTASTVMDSTSSSTSSPLSHMGIGTVFGSIGGLLHRLFGFF